MIILPDKEYKDENNEKIKTYQFLANLDCPVFNSVLFEENESLTEQKILDVKKALNSEECTIRYQYIKPCINPIRGGNKIKISLDILKSKQLNGTKMWLLEPIDRTKNIYGINVYVNRNSNCVVIETVGKGFDVSDLNRGDITPQESLTFYYPIEYGWQNEWWKYTKIKLVDKDKFNEDKLIRLNKLKNLKVSATKDIFDENYKQMDVSLIEKLLKYIEVIDKNWDISDEYTTSISMNSNGKLIFGDIQTPKGKQKILRKK